jgi:hypothetical protein
MFKVGREHRRWRGSVVSLQQVGLGLVTLPSCNLGAAQHGVRQSALSRCRRRGWTEETSFFQCRSNLSNLSNQIRKREKKASLFLPNFFNRVRLRLKLPTAISLARADRLAWLDGANNGGHYSRPTSRSRGWTR